MLGRRKPQRSLFEADIWPHRVAEDSIYGRMAAVGDVLFKDDDLGEMYCPDNGRPSLPPSLLCGVLLLQFHDGVGDEEAVERLRYDLRWKVALGLRLDYAGFDPTSLVVFRKRLLKYGQEHYAFERFLKVAREAGFLPEKVRQLLDSTPMKGAGAVQDTYTLLRKGIRRLLKAMGFAVAEKRRGLQTELRGYIESDEKAKIDWSDAKARRKQLARLVRDADAALELAWEQADDDEVRLTGWLLTKILGDDVVTGEDGKPELGEGVARDRMVSWTDPEMRHGRKSASSRWNGDKIAVAEEPETELITEIGVTDAHASDGARLLPMIDSVEEHLEVKVVEATGDTAYGGVDNRVACAKRGIDLVSPVATPQDPEVDKSAFQIDEVAGTLTCPGGETVAASREVKDAAGRPVKEFAFARETCLSCPLFERCVRSKIAGRMVTLNYHEDVLRAARQRQETDEFRTVYRGRSKVERKIAELMEHGLRQARYVGRKKKQLQALWTAAAVNLKRLFKLAKGDAMLIGRALAKLSPGQRALAASKA
jgi:transposase